ncbi:MAG: SH3 domain-containing protein, partial [Actinomycetota bacterium]|nr:SH3 domain-containing protein [Actinomycetota bacterium]
NDPNTGWMQFVMCQEIGHTFGLGHVNEAFNDPNTGSCMDYTSNPLGPPNNLHPNGHDFDQLASIYRHKDSRTTVASTSGAAAAGLERAVAANPAGPGQGGVSVFETDLGGGDRLVTFVIWADVNLMAAAHANERAPVSGTTTDQDGFPVDGEATGFAAGTTVVTNDVVNLRTGASRQADIVTELAAGTLLTVTGAVEQAQGLVWVPVVTADGTLAGYVAADFLAPA